jgi:hypothetical protein
MKKALFKINAFFKNNPTGRMGAHKSKGQSLVEIAIAFPFILMLLSGLVEFGFMLNFYLSLLDATRESARIFSNFDPFEDGMKLGNCQCPATLCPDEAAEDRIDVDCDKITFYQGAAGMVLDTLQPRDLNGDGIIDAQERNRDSSRRVILDRTADDVIVSVFSVGAGGTLRYPETNGGEYRWFNNLASRLSVDEINNRLIAGAPDTGILLVEVFYNYHQVLGLPWLAPFLPDPVLLHAYTFMPLPAAEPTTGP